MKFCTNLSCLAVLIFYMWNNPVVSDVVGISCTGCPVKLSKSPNIGPPFDNGPITRSLLELRSSYFNQYVWAFLVWSTKKKYGEYVTHRNTNSHAKTHFTWLRVGKIITITKQIDQAFVLNRTQQVIMIGSLSRSCDLQEVLNKLTRWKIMYNANKYGSSQKHLCTHYEQ